MQSAFRKGVILGATGPVGRHLAEAMGAAGLAVRVVSRHLERLERLFPDDEHVTADVLDPEGVRRAIDGCDIVFHSVGFPGPQLHEHRAAAQHLAAALRGSAAKCVHISSFWSFMPLVGNPLDEKHPRQGGPDAARHRRAAEDTLRDAGAAIVNLPDFYGPYVHQSTLQQPLMDAANGKTMKWIGSTETEREYAFVPDAVRTILALAERQDAYGEHWLVPTAGPLNGRRAAEIANDVLVRKIKVRAVPPAALRMLALFDASLRGFTQVLPGYTKPLRYETLKIEGLLGPQPVTLYEEGIRTTLEWLRAQ